MHYKTILWALAFIVLMACTPSEKTLKIDREALVKRHNVKVEGFDPLSALAVGNGNFAFTTDLTGLQTFYSDYEDGMPLGTQSNWGWHTCPNNDNYSIDETLKYFEVEGRQVPYRHQLNNSKRATDACTYFRANPHRLHLGMIGLRLIKENGGEAGIEDIKEAVHQLDLWTGCISSDFIFEGKPVHVEVFCSQETDMIVAKVSSPLIKTGQLAVKFHFPGPVVEHKMHVGYNFNEPELHQSEIRKADDNRVLIHRTIDHDNYDVVIGWQGEASLQNSGKHQFILAASGSDALEFSCLFKPEVAEFPSPVLFDNAKAENTGKWLAFWQSGGAVDFSKCTDPRAKELERRVVLSQYLTKIHSSGNLPPAETGLVYNSWYGKYHLEMHWWHIAHFAQWQRGQYMEPQLDYYNQIYDLALETAKEQGYKGVRWPKMIGPDGQNSPSSVGSYLIWQQPHIIWFAEQMYRANPTEETLNKYKELVFSTADFMADFPVWNENKKQYDLAPPLIPAQEHWSRETSTNPPFELAYWYWGLTKAQEWRERLNVAKNEEWENVRLHLAEPDKANGVYLGVKDAVNSYTNKELMRDHPIVLGAYGILPKWDKIDSGIMQNTLQKIAADWDWPSTWGWDYPLAAMSAVRLGQPEMALELLLKDVQKNTYLLNGHNYQSERLRVYLPGNGGLLQTIAMMCAGWEGCENTNPGFPENGQWDVKWENISPVF